MNEAPQGRIVERFFYSESDAIQHKIESFYADLRAAKEACRSFIAEVGASGMRHYSNGHVAGMEFKGRKAGWTRSYLGVYWPSKKTKEGKELCARMERLELPTASTVFTSDNAFGACAGVIDGRNMCFPTAVIARRKGGRSRVIVRVSMYRGAPSSRERLYPEQFEANFSIPDGFVEWKEWEMLRFIDEYNASVKAKGSLETTP